MKAAEILVFKKLFKSRKNSWAKVTGKRGKYSWPYANQEKRAEVLRQIKQTKKGPILSGLSEHVKMAEILGVKDSKC